MSNFSFRIEVLKDTLKSRRSYLVVIPAFIFTAVAGFFAPRTFEILNFQPDAIGEILPNLFTGFVAIPSTILAVAAILFSVLQVFNRKITITRLVFQNIYIIPLTYWSLLNTIALVFIQLVNDSLPSYIIIRILVIISYNLILLFSGLLFTFYRLFHYLDPESIVEDYIKNIYLLFDKELDPAFSGSYQPLLKQKSKEVYAEIVDCIERNEELMLAKYLESFNYTLSRNATSNYSRDFAHHLAKWINQSYDSRSSLSTLLIEFWRSRLVDKVEADLRPAFHNIERIPILSYIQASEHHSLRKRIVYEFSMRLREMVQKAIWLAEQDVTNIDNQKLRQLISIHSEISELLKEQILNMDLENITVVLNDVRMMQSAFKNNTFHQIRDEVLSNRAHRQKDDDGIDQGRYRYYTLLREALRDVEMIVIGNLFWIYFQIFNDKIDPGQPDLKSIVNLLENNLRLDDILDTIIHLYYHEDRRLDWDEWIWKADERLNGEVYSIPGIAEIVASGFAVTLLRDHHFDAQMYPIDETDAYKFLLRRTRDFLNAVLQFPDRWCHILNVESDQLGNIVNTALQLIEDVENRIEDNFLARLALQPVSEEKIIKFRETMQNDWESTRNLSNIFEEYDAIEVNPAESLVDVGPNINFTRGKVMFIEGELYSYIHGIDWAKDVNRYIESRFAHKIRLFARPSNAQNLSEIFDKGLDYLSSKKFRGNIIFIDSFLFNTNLLALEATGKIKKHRDEKGRFDTVGIYNGDIPVVAIRDYSFRNIVMIAHLPEAMVMQQRRNENYYKEKLIIEVESINEAKAEKLIKERQEEGKAALSSIELMASMHVHVHQIFDFKVINQEAIAVFKAGLENIG